MEINLLKTDKFNGRYVAMKSADDHTVVSSGETPAETLESARKDGFQDPILVYVPLEESVHIYRCRFMRIHSS
jgi:hypothetical protein